MMKNKNCVLLPTFCIHNGIIILWENDEEVCFGVTENNEEIFERLERAVKKNYGKNCSFKNISRDVFLEKSARVFSEKRNELTEKNNEKETNMESEAEVLLNGLITNGRKNGASDIHFEKGIVRFREKGNISRAVKIDEEIEGYVIRRIKLLAKMNVLETRRCQDGQFVFEGKDKKPLYIRVSSVPVVGSGEDNMNESIVLRLLDPEKIVLDLDLLGFEKKDLNNIKKMCFLENGLVLVCGATNSGKTTTVCSMLKEINRQDKNSKKIITIENPPEYLLEGITQMEVNDSVNMGFDEILKSSLRQDPDVVFIGEVRDEKTAEVALEASLTGHLVIATVHCGSIEECYYRMQMLCNQNKVFEKVVKGIICQKLKQGVLEAKVKMYE